ncbi:MAG: CSLREA domain-containing protein [Nitrospinota bacterium]|nr:CSLREA domain-containing protein [Nitrospinota bacterium]
MKRVLLSRALYILLVCFGALLPGVAGAAGILVTTTADTVATDGACSLREAINNVNAIGETTGGDCIFTTGIDSIVLPAGRYVLTGANGDDANLSGDLDIFQPVTIVGAGAASTVIDGNGAVTNDRVIHIINDVRVSMYSIKITGGNIAGKWPTGNGGGIFSRGDVSLYNSTIANNTGTDGGGIYSVGYVYLYRSALLNNLALNSYGGMASNSFATVVYANIIGNSAELPPN